MVEIIRNEIEQQAVNESALEAQDIKFLASSQLLQTFFKIELGKDLDIKQQIQRLPEGIKVDDEVMSCIDPSDLLDHIRLKNKVVDIFKRPRFGPFERVGQMLEHMLNRSGLRPKNPRPGAMYQDNPIMEIINKSCKHHGCEGEPQKETHPQREYAKSSEAWNERVNSESRCALCDKSYFQIREIHQHCSSCLRTYCVTCMSPKENELCFCCDTFDQEEEVQLGLIGRSQTPAEAFRVCQEAFSAGSWEQYKKLVKVFNLSVTALSLIHI